MSTLNTIYEEPAEEKKKATDPLMWNGRTKSTMKANDEVSKILTGKPSMMGWYQFKVTCRQLGIVIVER